MKKVIVVFIILVFFITSIVFILLKFFKVTPENNLNLNLSPRVQNKFNGYAKIMQTDPVWYQNPKLKPQLDEYFREPEEGKSDEFIKEKRAFIQLVGDLLEQGKIRLGKPTDNYDEGRKPLDLIVIHHTETAQDANFNYINGIHLFTLYILPIFDNPENADYGKPIFSGHYDNSGRQVFYGYHYLVRPDGTIKKALKDEYIGYHAIQANDHSIGIAIIGDYSKTKPSSKAINSVKKIIGNYKNLEVAGHREVVSTTECPGDPFFGEKGWKKDII